MKEKLYCGVWRIANTTPTEITMENIYNNHTTTITPLQFKAVEEGRLEISTIISNTLYGRKTNGVIRMNKKIERRIKEENER